MRSNKFLFWVLLMGVTAGCGGGSVGNPPTTGSNTGNPSAGNATGAGEGTNVPVSGSGATPVNTGDGGTVSPGSGVARNNVLAITVNGALCSANSYPNKPCVSVTVCTPGTTTCQTVTDILLDTGSYGLRIFKQALTVSLPPVTNGSGTVAECVQFGDGSADWGPVQTASVILGDEPPVQVPIQVIDATFSSRPLACQTADQGPADAGFNGILGVGLFAQDCGTTCTRQSNNRLYYACTGASCSGTTVSLANQVQNPVTLLPVDNNGVIVQLPSVPRGGVPAVDGALVFGIGTQANNSPASVATYATNQSGEFTTTIAGKTYSSFIDTGSNGLFFTAPSAALLPNCAAPDSGWFCPPATTNLTATNVGVPASQGGEVSFQIDNFTTLINTSNSVLAEIGGNMSGGFDWGLPFYFGRNVYLGFAGRGSSLGNGPYWAY
jgi:uncharacterized protein DUF3443